MTETLPTLSAVPCPICSLPNAYQWGDAETGPWLLVCVSRHAIDAHVLPLGSDCDTIHGHELDPSIIARYEKGRPAVTRTLTILLTPKGFAKAWPTSKTRPTATLVLRGAMDAFVRMIDAGEIT